jgi:hypothetical protein
LISFHKQLLLDNKSNVAFSYGIIFFTKEAWA